MKKLFGKLKLFSKGGKSSCFLLRKAFCIFRSKAGMCSEIIKESGAVAKNNVVFTGLGGRFAVILKVV